MTHQMQSNDPGEAVQLLADNGFEGMANAMQILFNDAMRLERTEYIVAEPYERTDQRRSHANVAAQGATHALPVLLENRKPNLTLAKPFS